MAIKIIGADANKQVILDRAWLDIFRLTNFYNARRARKYIGLFLECAYQLGWLSQYDDFDTTDKKII